MARIRTVKHEFFLDDRLSELSAVARLTFIGLWTLADREGRLRDAPKRIRAELFPYEPKTDMEAILGELAKGRFIVRYAVGQQAFIQIRNFGKHQRPNMREPNSEIPPPPRDAIQDTCEHVQAHAEETTSDCSAARNGSGEWISGNGSGEGEGNGSRELTLAVISPVQEVFAHYRTHHPRSKLLEASKEGKAIKARLAEGFSVEDLKRAIDGYHQSPYHQGQNDTGTKYLDLELMVRDSAKVNKGIQFHDNPPLVGTSQKEIAGKTAVEMFAAMGRK